MTSPSGAALNKVAQVSLAFWIIKICATTLGETAGDQLSTTIKLGYAASTAIVFGVFLVAPLAQIAAKRYHRLLYWSVILSTTAAGATLGDTLTKTHAKGGLDLGTLPSSLGLAAAIVVFMAIAGREPTAEPAAA